MVFQGVFLVYWVYNLFYCKNILNNIKLAPNMRFWPEKFSSRFKNRYRLIVRKDENLEEKVSITLTPLNLALILSSFLLLFGTMIYFLLGFTPLSVILPQNNTPSSNKEKYAFVVRIDSLESELNNLKIRSEMLDNVLKSSASDPITAPVDVQTSTSALQSTVKSNDYHTATSLPKRRLNYTFVSPVSGVVTDTFNLARKHFGTDIASKTNSVVKVVQAGTVIYSGWSPEVGHTIVVQHYNDFISVYKHNAALLKKEGNFVKSNEAIALVGNSGELTSGPHLHFELWHRGVPLNPQSFISF